MIKSLNDQIVSFTTKKKKKSTTTTTNDDDDEKTTEVEAAIVSQPCYRCKIDP